jgi:hypothetical protein
MRRPGGVALGLPRQRASHPQRGRRGGRSGGRRRGHRRGHRGGSRSGRRRRAAHRGAPGGRGGHGPGGEARVHRSQRGALPRRGRARGVVHPGEPVGAPVSDAADHERPRPGGGAGHRRAAAGALRGGRRRPHHRRWGPRGELRGRGRSARSSAHPGGGDAGARRAARGRADRARPRGDARARLGLGRAGGRPAPRDHDRPRLARPHRPLRGDAPRYQRSRARGLHRLRPPGAPSGGDGARAPGRSRRHGLAGLRPGRRWLGARAARDHPRGGRGRRGGLPLRRGEPPPLRPGAALRARPCGHCGHATGAHALAGAHLRLGRSWRRLRDQPRGDAGARSSLDAGDGRPARPGAGLHRRAGSGGSAPPGRRPC